MQAATQPVLKHRIESIDILRGLIMLIMAIDHTRDYFHLGHPEPTDLATTTPFLFFTRLITHFCAPTFVFLSGISAYLAGTRRTKRQLSAFLLTRGLWLMLVEVLIINFAMTLDPGYHLAILQVIWAIGGSMVLLSLVVWLPLPIIGAIGLIIFFGHNMLDVIRVGATGKTVWFKLLLSANGFGSVLHYADGRNVIIAYALLPWTGVMLLGYVFGQVYQSGFEAAKRKKILLISGLGLLAVFVVFRAFNVYGDPAPWSVQKTTVLSIISFFNVSKYPCSMLYNCLTVGTAIVALSQVENIRNKFTAILVVYGNVPFFYYVCHWYLIRLINIITFIANGFTLKQMVSFDPPASYGYSLGVVYLIWLIVIVTLYLPCRWYGRYKKSHTQWWLSYL